MAAIAMNDCQPFGGKRFFLELAPTAISPPIEQHELLPRWMDSASLVLSFRSNLGMANLRRPRGEEKSNVAICFGAGSGDDFQPCHRVWPRRPRRSQCSIRISTDLSSSWSRGARSGSDLEF